MQTMFVPFQAAMRILLITYSSQLFFSPSILWVSRALESLLFFSLSLLETSERYTVCQPLAHRQLLQCHCHCLVCLCWQYKCSHVGRCRHVQRFCSIEYKFKCCELTPTVCFWILEAEVILESC